jgi:hypothetical protein
VRRGVVWCSAAQHGVAQHSAAQCRVVWHSEHMCGHAQHESACSCPAVCTRMKRDSEVSRSGAARARGIRREWGPRRSAGRSVLTHSGVDHARLCTGCRGVLASRGGRAGGSGVFAPPL